MFKKLVKKIVLSIYLAAPGLGCGMWDLVPDQGQNSRPRQVINAGEGVEKREPSYTIGGSVNWYIHQGEQYGGVLKKLKMELPNDPAVTLLGMYAEKTIF